MYCQFKDALYQKESEIYAIDEHAKIMKNYPDIKEKVYLIYFIVLVISTVLVCEFTPFLQIFQGIAHIGKLLAVWAPRRHINGSLSPIKCLG